MRWEGQIRNGQAANLGCFREKRMEGPYGVWRGHTPQRRQTYSRSEKWTGAVEKGMALDSQRLSLSRTCVSARGGGFVACLRLPPPWSRFRHNVRVLQSGSDTLVPEPLRPLPAV